MKTGLVILLVIKLKRNLSLIFSVNKDVKNKEFFDSRIQLTRIQFALLGPLQLYK